MDDKASVMAILEAVEHLLGNGFLPKRTLYLAFGHDEEVGGHGGAAKIAELLRSRGVELEFVLDEGMNILNGIVPGISAPVALIGIAEKGYLSLSLTAETSGGHSSIPPAQTAIGMVGRALQKLDTEPFPSRLSGPTRQMFEFLGPEMGWTNKLALANLWLFDPLVRRTVGAIAHHQRRHPHDGGADHFQCRGDRERAAAQRHGRYQSAPPARRYDCQRR